MATMRMGVDPRRALLLKTQLAWIMQKKPASVKTFGAHSLGTLLTSQFQKGVKTATSTRAVCSKRKQGGVLGGVIKKALVHCVRQASSTLALALLTLGGDRVVHHGVAPRAHPREVRLGNEEVQEHHGADSPFSPNTLSLT